VVHARCNALPAMLGAVLTGTPQHVACGLQPLQTALTHCVVGRLAGLGSNPLRVCRWATQPRCTWSTKRTTSAIVTTASGDAAASLHAVLLQLAARVCGVAHRRRHCCYCRQWCCRRWCHHCCCRWCRRWCRRGQ
jgi:hypothetical protein